MPDGDGDKGQAIFVQGENNTPVLFHLHRSVSGGQKVTLEADILRYGGELCEDERDADTIIVHHDRLAMIHKKHLHNKGVYVEEVNFVHRCIERKVYSHEKPLKRNIGGRPAGSVRNEYTRSDDLNLVQYLSEQVPYKETGGRTGNTIYQELCNEFFSENYPWAERHPWQSWRNRYKKNQGRFDQEIDKYLVIHPPHPDHVGEYSYRKRADDFGRYRNGRRQRVVNEYRVEEEDEEEIGIEGYGLNENAARDRLDEEEDNNDVIEIPRPRAAQQAAVSMTFRADRERLKRKLASGREGGDTSPLEQGRTKQKQRRNSIENEDAASSRESLTDAQDNNMMRLDYNPEDGFTPNLEQENLAESLTVEPSNTQATLVATQVRRPAATKGPVAGPSSLASTQVRVRAARNSERTRALLAQGARLKTATILPIDTQATAVPSQTNRHAQLHQTQEGPASGTRVQERSPSLGAEFVSAANSPQHASRQDGQARRVEIEETTVARPASTPKALDKKRERAARKTPSKSAMRPPTQIVLRSSSPIPVPGPLKETRNTRVNQRTAAVPSAPPAPTKPSQTQTVSRDAPYRNTRARSRSVEPQPLPTTNHKGKAAMQAVQEEPAEVDFISADPPVETESYNEQQSVEAVEDALDINESEEEEEEEAGDYSNSSDSDSDADNVIRDTAKKLRESGLHHGFYGTSDAGLRSTFASPASLVKPPAVSTPKPASSAIKTDGSGRRTSLLGSQIRVRHATPAAESELTSEHAFPTPGTRAEEERRRLAREEEMQPYVPAPGTRAAEILSRKGKQRAR